LGAKILLTPTSLHSNVAIHRYQAKPKGQMVFILTSKSFQFLFPETEAKQYHTN
jgi:hypothetical protein